MTYPSYEEWLAGLSEEQRQRAVALTERFRTLGADNPEGWARSEISEDFAQLARYLVLRALWPKEIDSWARDPQKWIERVAKEAASSPQGHFADAGRALARMGEAGVSAADIGSLARMIAYSATFGVLYRIGEGSDLDAGDDTPGWALMETDPAGAPTGRLVGALYESILSLDPSGREGRSE